MSIKGMGQNSAEEFFETILYMTAYNEARTLIQGYTKDIENPVLKEAVESSMNVLVFGAVFYAIQKGDGLVAFIFDKAEAVFLFLFINPAKRGLQRLKNMKGTKLSRLISFFSSKESDNIAIAHVIATHQGAKAVATSTSMSASNPMSIHQLQNDTKNTLYNRERLNFEMGSKMAGRYNETLLFKLMTKSFTPQDEMLMKKVLGRDTASVLHMDDLNKVADFMYTTDTNGKIIGLSTTFLELVNGLGYMHNK